MTQRASASGLYSPISGLGRVSFNAASGGTEATVTNFNGTGQIWKTHTFNSNSTLTITKAPQTFRVLVVGGGNNGGGGGGYCAVGGQGAWGEAIDTTQTLTTGAITVTVGSVGGNTVFGSATGRGGVSTTRISSNITGASVTYAGANGGDGSCGCIGSPGSPGTAPGGGGGGGGGAGNCSPFQAGGGGAGAAGRVVVAYRIG